MATEMARRNVYPRISGHPALDLVNTVQWRLSQQRFEDDLLDYDDVVRWARQLEVIHPDDADALRSEAARAPKQAQEEYVRVLALREAEYRVLYEGDDAEPLTAEYRQAVAAGELAHTGVEWDWALPTDLALPRRRIAIQIFDLLTRGDLSRLAQCQDAECGWVFLDTSPRHNRRWCVSADCGNRNRVRDFYARSRDS